jgi:hypothetical protein
MKSTYRHEKKKKKEREKREGNKLPKEKPPGVNSSIGLLDVI